MSADRAAILPDVTSDGTAITNAWVAAAFVGDGFLVTVDQNTVTIARVEGDGTFGGATTSVGLPGAHPEMTALALVSDGVRTELQYSEQEQVNVGENLPFETRWVPHATELDSHGHFIASSMLDSTVTGIAIGPGHDPFALAVATDGVRLLGVGDTAGAPLPIASTSNGARFSAIVRRGDELVAGWGGAPDTCAGLALARLAP